jgi:ABC-type sugar transport system substrate-binding protein
MTFEVQDVSNDAAKENEILSAFATRQVDLVMASVVSPSGSLAAIGRLESAGIPVVCYNTCLAPPDDRELTEAFVTNDQVALGEATGAAAAEYIATELGGSATIAYLTCETYDVCKLRRDGLESALAAVDVTVVAEQEGFVVDKATPVATSMLAAHPEIDVIIAENEDAVVAAATAIAARGQTGRTVVFGIGINPTVAQLLLEPDRTVRMVTGQAAEEWAREAVRVAQAIRDGEDTGGYEHFTPGPVYTADDPAAVQDYLETR